MISPELQSKFASWRAKAADGTLTEDEMREAIASLRVSRLAAASSASTSKKRAALREIPKAEDLLGEMEDL